jgi:MYXO-CTERM domain-containing protein
MRPTTHLAIACALAIGLAACGGPVQPEPGISPRDAPHLLAPAICAQAYKCCTMSQLMNNDAAGTDEATCEMKTEAALTKQVASIEASERKGRVNYDGVKVSGCIDYLTSINTSCDELNMTFHLSGVPACAAFLEPEVALGGACTLDFECVDGFCDLTGVTGGADGKCRAFANVGESCANMSRCAAGLICDTTAMTCTAAPVGGQSAPMCFYSSGCSDAGGNARSKTTLALAALAMAALVRRRRA